MQGQATVANTAIDVISMAGAGQRRAEFAEQARLAQVSWRFVDAATRPTPQLTYNEDRAVRKFGRALSPGEIGCFVSHHTAWMALLESGDKQRLVLEDDVIADWRVIQRLLDLDIGSLGLELVRLYATHPFHHRIAINRFLAPHIHLVQALGMFLGCQGYLLTRHAAERMVQLADSTIEMPVDWLMTRYWEYGFPNYCLFPFPLIERTVPSDIGDRSQAAPRLPGESITRLYWRVADRISRGFADHVRFRRNPFGATPDGGPSFADRLESSPTA
jgi:glycosyl transferase, family 25